MVRRITFVALCSLALLGVVVGRALQHPAYAAAGGFSVSYTGTNYYQPTDYFNHCGYWTWLTSCYTDSSSGPSAQSQVGQDAQFMAANGLGTFQRVWISLDQLMNWDSTNGYQSYNPAYLANVDDMLHRMAQSGIKVDLVLLTHSQGAGTANQFHPEAVDGYHSTMRANYLRAVHDFLTHVGSDPTDASTIAVVDLQNEAYYQLEVYFNNPSNLGAFTQCLSGSGGTDWGCVDNTIIHPWLNDLYSTAKSAAPNLLYTVSDAGGMLNANSMQQQQRENLYPVDVYDIHAYSDSPSSDPTRWASGKLLNKPWFVGEAGCGVGDTSCTYDGTNAAPIDKWWLDNLRADGASAVLVEEGGTAFTFPDGPYSPVLTATGQEIKQVTLDHLSSGSQLPTSTPTPVQPSGTPTAVPPTSTPAPTSTPVPFITPIAMATPEPINMPVPVVQPTTVSGSTPISPWSRVGNGGMRSPVIMPVPALSGPFQATFDNQAQGPLALGSVSGYFSGVVNGSQIAVSSSDALSAPNSMAVAVNGGGSAFAYHQALGSANSYSLRFGLRLGSDFNIPASEYLVLAQTLSHSGAASSVGKVNLVLTGNGGLYLSYVDSSGTQQYVWSNAVLNRSWHTIEIRETTGVGAGSLALLVDGTQVGATSSLDTGGQPIGYFALGEEYSPSDSGTSGHLYFDNVTATL